MGKGKPHPPPSVWSSTAAFAHAWEPDEFPEPRVDIPYHLQRSCNFNKGKPTWTSLILTPDTLSSWDCCTYACVFKGFLLAVLLRMWLSPKLKRGGGVEDFNKHLFYSDQQVCSYNIYKSKINVVVLCSPIYVIVFLLPFLGSSDGCYSPSSPWPIEELIQNWKYERHGGNGLKIHCS